MIHVRQEMQGVLKHCRLYHEILNLLLVPTMNGSDRQEQDLCSPRRPLSLARREVVVICHRLQGPLGVAQHQGVQEVLERQSSRKSHYVCPQVQGGCRAILLIPHLADQQQHHNPQPGRDYAKRFCGSRRRRDD